MANKYNYLTQAPFSLRDPSRVIYDKVMAELKRQGRRSEANDFDLRVRNVNFSKESIAKQIVLEASRRYFNV